MGVSNALGIRTVGLAVMGMVLAGVIASPAEAVTPTLAIQSGTADVGQVQTLTIDLSEAESGIAGYDLVATLTDPTVASIVGAELPDFGLTAEEAISSSQMRIRAVDLTRLIEPGATNELLATLWVQGLAPGRTAVELSVNRIDDDAGLPIVLDTVSGSIDVLNVAPVVQAGADAIVDHGTAFAVVGSFSDTADDSWTATVDYGDGTGAVPLALNGTSFNLDHVYAVPGVYIVTVTVTDGYGGVGTDSVRVEVLRVYPTLPGMTSPAQDLDGDGRAEDVNGNGRPDFADLVVLFANVDDPVVQGDVSAFDFNGNGLVDTDDVVELFSALIL